MNSLPSRGLAAADPEAPVLDAQHVSPPSRSSYCVSVATVMTTGALVVRVVQELPEAASLVSEHLDDNFGEALLHPLVSDLLLFALEAWKQNQADVVQRCLTMLDGALSTGDDEVENAVAVSFVEDSSWWDVNVQFFIATWPPGLMAGMERQRGWKRGP